MCTKSYASYSALYHHKKEKLKEPDSVGTDKQPTEDGKMVMGSVHPENNTQAENDTQAEGTCHKNNRRNRLDIDRKYACSICDKKCGNKRALNAHNKNKHTS